ncbi:MAG: DUF4143 domain-containing protein, partial [Bacteroidales bacterium]|nr:DUF4143 domain-containing protein [Bacteroidales bacterium]
SKRLIKSPKLYFVDIGLASYLLGIENKQHIFNHPLRGSLFENLILMELVKQRLNNGLDSNFYFFRDKHGNEVDIIFGNAKNLIAIEIKSSETYHGSFLKGIKYFEKLYKKNLKNGYVIYSGKNEQSIENIKLINFLKTQNIFD